MEGQKPISFSQHLRALREAVKLSLKQVAADLDIDPSLLAKFERNERQPVKALIKTFAEYYNIDHNELVKQYLSDQIVNKILDEDQGLEILKVAEKKVVYLKSKKHE